jgi:hypothetical protein
MCALVGKKHTVMTARNDEAGQSKLGLEPEVQRTVAL